MQILTTLVGGREIIKGTTQMNREMTPTCRSGKRPFLGVSEWRRSGRFSDVGERSYEVLSVSPCSGVAAKLGTASADQSTWTQAPGASKALPFCC